MATYKRRSRKARRKYAQWRSDAMTTAKAKEPSEPKRIKIAHKPNRKRITHYLDPSKNFNYTKTLCGTKGFHVTEYYEQVSCKLCIDRLSRAR